MLLITGADGQLAQSLRATLTDDALFASRKMLDITDEDQVCRVIAEYGIDTVINCAAYTAVDEAESAPSRADSVNCIGAANLARHAPRMIHISTDYVFDGSARIPYRETDPCRPINVYGRSKLAGERAVLSESHCVLVLRTSWLYGKNGNNFLRTILRLGTQRDVLRIVSDQVGIPTCTDDLALAIAQLLPRMRPNWCNIYHCCNQGTASWYEFAREIVSLADLPCRVEPISSAQYPCTARRPAYSVLDCRKIDEDFGIRLPHWSESLARCINHLPTSNNSGES